MKKILLALLILLVSNSTQFNYSFTTTRPGCTAFAANVMSVTYYFTTVNDDKIPYAQNFVPANGAVGVPVNTSFSFNVCDDETGIDASSIRVDVNGVTVAHTLTAISNGYKVTVSGLIFGYKQTPNIIIWASDLAE